MKPLLALAALALLAPTVAASLEAVHDVSLRSSRFNPNVLQIASGDTVVWTNNDPFGHTVTAYDGSFGSGVLSRGQTFTHTFTSPGVVPYHCTIHPLMIALVVVQ